MPKPGFTCEWGGWCVCVCVCSHTNPVSWFGFNALETQTRVGGEVGGTDTDMDMDTGTGTGTGNKTTGVVA
jgi:hypothetical protein